MDALWAEACSQRPKELSFLRGQWYHRWCGPQRALNSFEAQYPMTAPVETLFSLWTSEETRRIASKFCDHGLASHNTLKAVKTFYRVLSLKQEPETNPQRLLLSF